MSYRFQQAIIKLYQAYHNNQLHPECACQCAVGNICDNSDRWKHLSDQHGSLQLNYIGYINEQLSKRLNGYLPSELLRIEQAFLQGCGYQLPLKRGHFKPNNPQDKQLLFDGLCAAITVLCKLEQIDDITNYSRLFKTDPKQATHCIESIYN